MLLVGLSSVSLAFAGVAGVAVLAAQPALAATATGEGLAQTLSQAVSDAAPPSETPLYPGGASGFSHFVFERVGDDIITSLVEGPRGPQVRTPLSYVRLQQLLDSGEAPPAESRLTREQLATLVGQLDALREATDKYRDIDVALADGYRQTTGEVPNMGAHFNHSGRTRDGVFNPAEPEILIYARDEQGEWELVGISFVLPRRIAGDDHPDGFEGQLDNWHVHYALCLRRGASGRTAAADECRRTGGIFLPSYGWMIHAWVYRDNPLGVFSMWNPNIPPLVSEDSIRQTRSRRPTDLPEGAGFVSIENFEFSTISVDVGASVVWTNADGVVHTVTGGSSGIDDGSFDSGLIGPGQAFTQRFDTPGVYAFTCTLHPAMNGTGIVGGSES